MMNTAHEANIFEAIECLSAAVQLLAQQQPVADLAVLNPGGPGVVSQLARDLAPHELPPSVIGRAFIVRSLESLLATECVVADVFAAERQQLDDVRQLVDFACGVIMQRIDSRGLPAMLRSCAKVVGGQWRPRVEHAVADISASAKYLSLIPTVRSLLATADEWLQDIAEQQLQAIKEPRPQ